MTNGWDAMSDEIKLPGLDKWTKPNVRKIFLPDIDHVLFEVDLKQSDAQVVAWDSEEKAQLMDGKLVKGRLFRYKPDNTLKDIFRSGGDLHTTNARDIYGISGTPTNHQRQNAKHGVHATDFLSTPKNMAKKLDMTIIQATNFQNRWFALHPNIAAWHAWIELELMTKKVIVNKFGYARRFFGRVEQLLPEAVAQIPQSTTVNVIDKIMNRISGDPLRGVVGEIPEVEILLQVHDSIVGQFHVRHWPEIVPRIEACTNIEVPYDDKLRIGTDFSCSASSWGNVRKIPWTDFKSSRNGASGTAGPAIPA